MIDITDELIVYLRAFNKQFKDIVPLRELPSSTTTEELIDSIKYSIEIGENILPVKFGYGQLNKNIDI